MPSGTPPRLDLGNPAVLGAELTDWAANPGFQILKRKEGPNPNTGWGKSVLRMFQNGLWSENGILGIVATLVAVYPVGAQA